MDDLKFVVTVPEEISTEICVKTDALQTVSVLIDILLNAKEYVVLSSPFLQDFAVVNPNLQHAIETALSRNVRLKIITTEKSLVGLNLSVLKGDIKVYQPVENIYDPEVLGSHAKFCLADGKAVYIGSANITGPGLGKHVEMGVYSRGQLARKVEKFWDMLNKKGLIVERP